MFNFNFIIFLKSDSFSKIFDELQFLSPKLIRVYINSNINKFIANKTINFKMMQIPIIDMSPAFDKDNTEYENLVRKIDQACQQVGFFIAEGHNVSQQFMKNVYEASRKFFDLGKQQKRKVSLNKQSIWRGWFDVGEQMTNGSYDGRQGFYLMNQKEKKDINVFPDKQVPQFRQSINKYIQEAVILADKILQCIALALEIPKCYFSDKITRSDPGHIFSVFNYSPNPEYKYGIGQHKDYGLIILLCIDENGQGLQVKTPDDKWIDVPVPSAGKYSMVVNLGDMLEKLTQGLYRSTPHRVQIQNNKRRISFPLFYDPNWDVIINDYVIDLPQQKLEKAKKYQQQSPTLRTWNQTHYDYVKQKAARSYPNIYGYLLPQQKQSKK